MRIKCFPILVAFLLIASVLTPAAYADSALVTGSEVFVRSGPGPDYAILGSYSRGSTVNVIDRSNGEWYAVNFNGTLGYMSSSYLSFEEDGASYPLVPDASAGQGITISVGQTAPAVPAQAASDTDGQITGMNVRFRSGPSSSSAVLAEYSQGKAVTVLGTEGEWTLCLIDGQYGYIYSQYVSRAGSQPVATPAVVVTPAPAPASYGTGIIIQEGPASAAAPSTPASGSGQSMIFAYTPSPYAGPAVPSPTPAPAPAVTAAPVQPAVSAPAGSTAGSINGDYVRFRRGPGTSYSIINSYDRGKALSIVGVEGDWVYCIIDGQSGYVFSQYVRANPSAVQTAATPAPVSTPTPAQTVTGSGTPGYIKGNSVRFRTGPDLSSGIIKELFYGNVVDILGNDGTWTAIVYEGQAGYVFSQYVAVGSFQTTSSGGTANGRSVADYALSLVGTPYCWGGIDPSTGFDCSGFVYYVYKHFGYTLNRVASEQALNGKHVEAADLQPGDLLCFYSGSSYIGHVGLYIGNNMFVHSATSSTGVITSELAGYYAQRGFEVRRIVG